MPSLKFGAGRALLVSDDSVAARAFLARTTALSQPYVTAYKNLLNGLTSDGLFNPNGTSDYFDALYIYANQDTTNALLNLVSASYPCVATGSPAFAAGGGYTGADEAAPQTTKYLDTGFNPSTASGKYTQNSAHLSAWSANDFTSVNGGVLIGVSETSVSGSNVIARAFPTEAYGRMNDGTDSSGITVANSQGLTLASRTGSGAQALYKNTTNLGMTPVTSGALANGTVAVLGLHLIPDNDYRYGYGGQVSAASIGAGLTGTQNTNFYNRMRTCMTAVGVP